jgi:hypothetical protein
VSKSKHRGEAPSFMKRAPKATTPDAPKTVRIGGEVYSTDVPEVLSWLPKKPPRVARAGEA